MRINASDLVMQRLCDWGTTWIYGCPAAGAEGLVAAAERMGPALQMVPARSARTCASMACAHARFSGQVGVCLAVPGLGAACLSSGLYEALLECQPVIAIVGVPAGAGDDALVALSRTVARDCVEVATNALQIPDLLDRALRIAVSRRTVTCLIVPLDVQTSAATPTPVESDAADAPAASRRLRCIVPEERELEAAAALLNDANRVAIVVGGGALGAGGEVSETADVLGAGVAQMLLGEAVLPDTLPFVTGPIGPLGSKPSWDMVRGCDALLVIGTGAAATEFGPEGGRPRTVRIDIDPAPRATRDPAELDLVGDAAPTLRALIPRLHYKFDRTWRESIGRAVARWWVALQAEVPEVVNAAAPGRAHPAAASQRRANRVHDAGAAAPASVVSGALHVVRGQAVIFTRSDRDGAARRARQTDG